METYYLVKGDTGSQLKVTLVEESTAAAIDCTNETVRLHFRKKGTTTLLFTLTSLVNDNNLLQEGIAIFDFEDQLLTLEAGYYTAEVELTNNTTSIVRTVYETLPFRVRDELG